MTVLVKPLVYAVLLVVGQCLDYYTTYLGVKDFSKEAVNKRELNPILALRLKNKKRILILKLCAVTALIFLCLKYPQYLMWLRVGVVWIFLVVASNIQAYWAERHGKRLAWLDILLVRLRIPKKLSFIVIEGLTGLVAVGIAFLLP